MSVSTASMNNSKRKAPPASLEVPSAEEASSNGQPAKVTPTALSPYEARMNLLREARPDGHILWQMCSVLDKVPGLANKFEGTHCSDWSEEQKKEAYASLTAEQCEAYVHYLIVPETTLELQQKYIQALYCADSRNEPGDSFVMLNTYSSWCMYPVIGKQLTAAVKEINKATKAINAQGGAIIPGIARQALEMTLAAVLACDECDHWRMDTESPEDCDKIARKVSKVAKDLLWFEDSELGFNDSFSRKALLARLADMDREWPGNSYMDEGIAFKTKKNGQGLGRSHAPPPPVKKAKAAPAATTVVAASGTSANSSKPFDVSYLGGIQDKLQLRVKTQVQLEISSVATPSQKAMVVVTGASDMKKINQVCAYVTGQSPVFEHHSQRGKCLKGSRLEVHLDGGTLWLAAKAMAKEAAAVGASHVEDKTVKIVQVFQGLNCTADTGITFDSEKARTVATTPGSVVWVAPDGQRFQVKVQAIHSNKCNGKSYPLPRLVKHGDYAPQAKTGFGMPLHKTNRYLADGRANPQLLLLGGITNSELNRIHATGATRPLCNEDGMVGEGVFSFMFRLEYVKAAGLPVSFQQS